MSRTLIIAEAGVNHNGDLNTALKLVDAAKNCGADVVKFQTFSAEVLVTESAEKATYQKSTTGEFETQLDMLRKLELNHESHIVLRDHCENIGIEFLSTGFDIAKLEILIDLGIKRIKIPSGDITNLPLLRYAGSAGLPVILSTGMAMLTEVSDALTVFHASGLAKEDIVVLHCTSEYPTPMQNVNLMAMKTLESTFKVSVGYSDHTVGSQVAVAAVALGARVIEKHITLDRTSPGPDHLASMEPLEFQSMVKAIRDVECALGDGVKAPRGAESENALIARKSLIAKKKITKGEIFTSENIQVKRPGNGFSPMRWDEALREVAPKDFYPDDLIEF